MVVVDVVDVGHGNATVIRESGITIVVDAAPGGALLAHLEEFGINYINLFILSHADYDHIGGLVAVLSSGIRVERVLLNSDGTKESQAWRDLIFALDDAQRSGVIEFEVGLTEGHLMVKGLTRCALDVVSPSRALAGLGVGGKSRCLREITSNSISAVIRVKEDDHGVALLAGDMDDIALLELERNSPNIEAELLVYPHHGGLAGGCDIDKFVDRLLAMVRPSTIAFSNGRGRYDNPRAEVVAAVKRNAAHGYICCTQLSERCAERHPDERARHIERKCAGRVRAEITNGAVEYPLRATHQELISRVVGTPMCS
ncbi:MBL fold metallo-hydrolase [Xanthomonas campestris pv. campestris]|uniref:ComEC/Rec2 family competence protein n=1 Tax=Xanthomonas campestris TaxID=339 RepID=UPI002AD1E6B7|nr:MBL fold metallo-hydrolase [Xanthomonas campestris]MEA0736879.1 MBL fold metallo-hydrolase [Xanthomonas campestris pv. campestris]